MLTTAVLGIRDTLSTTMAPGHHNQDTHTGRRNDGGRGNPTPLRTQGLSSNPRFSYMESPVEAQPGVFNQFSSPTNSSIDESPITPYTPQSQPMPHITEDARHSPYPEEKRAPNQVDVTYEAPVFLDVHSATFSPYAQASPREVYTPSATYPLSTLSPHQQSIAPVPRVVMRDAASSSVPETRYADIDRKQEFVRPSTTSRTPTYNPNALAGPNVALEYHRPGQMSHPNAAVQPQWKHGLCEADTLCCTGLFCPCILYGKTQYRLSQKSKRREATDLLGYKSFNGACGLMAVACGFQCK